MADSSTGFLPVGVYVGDGGDVNRLLALIPNIDTASSSGAIAGGGFLDEMSPVAALQLRVELNAINAAVGNPGGYRQGAYTVLAADVTATHADIVTGLADITIANCIVKITRAGADVTRDAAITEPVAGTIRVASGASTYALTAGDIIHFYAE